MRPEKAFVWVYIIITTKGDEHFFRFKKMLFGHAVFYVLPHSVELIRNKFLKGMWNKWSVQRYSNMCSKLLFSSHLIFMQFVFTLLIKDCKCEQYVLQYVDSPVKSFHQATNDSVVGFYFAVMVYHTGSTVLFLPQT